MTGCVAGCLAQNRMWLCAVVRAAACTGQQTAQPTIGHRLEKDGHSYKCMCTVIKYYMSMRFVDW